MNEDDDILEIGDGQYEVDFSQRSPRRPERNTDADNIFYVPITPEKKTEEDKPEQPEKSTVSNDLPYNGDLDAARRAQDRDAIRMLMIARMSKPSRDTKKDSSSSSKKTSTKAPYPPLFTQFIKPGCLVPLVGASYDMYIMQNTLKSASLSSPRSYSRCKAANNRKRKQEQKIKADNYHSLKLWDALVLQLMKIKEKNASSEQEKKPAIPLKDAVTGNWEDFEVKRPFSGSKNWRAYALDALKVDNGEDARLACEGLNEFGIDRAEEPIYVHAEAADKRFQTRNQEKNRVVSEAAAASIVCMSMQSLSRRGVEGSFFVDGKRIDSTHASWGSHDELLEAKLVRAQPEWAEAELTNAAALKGNVAVVRRGKHVRFVDKVARVVKAGAIGVVVINATALPTLRHEHASAGMFSVPVVLIGEGERQSFFPAATGLSAATPAVAAALSHTAGGGVSLTLNGQEVHACERVEWGTPTDVKPTAVIRCPWPKQEQRKEYNSSESAVTPPIPAAVRGCIALISSASWHKQLLHQNFLSCVRKAVENGAVGVILVDRGANCRDAPISLPNFASVKPKKKEAEAKLKAKEGGGGGGGSAGMQDVKVVGAKEGEEEKWAFTTNVPVLSIGHSAGLAITNASHCTLFKSAPGETLRDVAKKHGKPNFAAALKALAEGGEAKGAAGQSSLQARASVPYVELVERCKARHTPRSSPPACTPEEPPPEEKTPAPAPAPSMTAPAGAGADAGNANPFSNGKGRRKGRRKVRRGKYG